MGSAVVNGKRKVLWGEEKEKKKLHAQQALAPERLLLETEDGIFEI